MLDDWWLMCAVDAMKDYLGVLDRHSVIWETMYLTRFLLSLRIQISNNKGHLGEKPATGDLAPVPRPSDAAVGALIVMLKGARPLQEDPSNSLRSLQCCEVPSGNPGVQLDKECTPHVQQSGCHAVSLTTTLLKSKTAKDALEELRRYQEVKESIVDHWQKK